MLRFLEVPFKVINMNNHQLFRNLHEQNSPLQIGNVWDVNSALMFEKMGYQSIGTSSAAIADSLGYEDGEEMSFNELLDVVKSIITKTSLPLTVDIEAGYSRNTKEITKNIMLLNKAGVSGINIEDSVVISGKRKIVDAFYFSDILKTIKKNLTQENADIFLNVRTDFFIMGLENPLEETITRVALYEEAGADGIFVPCVTNAADIKKIVESLSTPLNVMCMPELPSFSTLQELGVSRISSGPFIYNKMKDTFSKILESINQDQSFESVFK